MIDPMLAYIGPETLMPLTSAVAAGVGAFLMFGRNTLRIFARFARVFSRGKS